MIGETLSHYRILEQIGAGGMGHVYRARDERLERDVAVKVLPAGALAGETERKRFRQEGLALSRLNHPCIETVHDVGSEEGVDFLVLELVPGVTLAKKLQDGPLSERGAAELGAQIAEALEEAHERGVLHRDLKPGNIIVTPKGRVKVLDFGLAQLLREAGDVTQTQGLTEAGSTTGTLAYMAPEQLLGLPADPRTDLYGLGIVLFEMVIGRRPFTASLSTALTNEILHGAFPPPGQLAPGLSRRMEAVILRCMERDPARRFQTASELTGVLRGLFLAAGAAGPDPESRGGAGPATRRITSIAVLPLENISGDAEQEYFAVGMTEELIASLAQVRALRTISRTSVMRYKGAQKAVTEIGRELGVDAVIEGSVRRAGDRVRITVQLVDAATDSHLWAKSYERDLRDILALQGEVAQAIVAEIQVNVTPLEEARLKTARAVHPEAYESYLKGRFFWDRRTEDSLRRGLAHFQEAIQYDPGYALAYVGVADTYNLQGYYTHVQPADAFPNAKAAAQKALALDPACAEARASLAYAVLYYDWDLPEAEREFRTAIDLNPRYLIAHLWLANVLLVTRRFEEALAEFQAARSIDPLSMISNTAAGWVFYYSGRNEEAVRQFRRCIELDPGFLQAHYWLGLTYVQQGRMAEALAEFERSVAIGGRVPYTLGGLAIAHAAAGRGEDARAMMREMDAMGTDRYVSPYYRAQALVLLGDRAAALDALGQALDERVHWLTFLPVDPLFDPLRGDPTFESLLRRIGVSR